MLDMRNAGSFWTCKLCIPNTDHVVLSREFSSMLFNLFVNALVQRMKLKRNYSLKPGFTSDASISTSNIYANSVASSSSVPFVRPKDTD